MTKLYSIMQQKSFEKATDLVIDGQPFKNIYVDGELKIEVNDHWVKEVVFENCIVESFSAIGQKFEKPVKRTNCHFKNCQFTFFYVLGGLDLREELFTRFVIVYELFDPEAITDDDRGVSTELTIGNPSLLFKNPKCDELFYRSGWSIPGTIRRLSEVHN